MYVLRPADVYWWVTRSSVLQREKDSQGNPVKYRRSSAVKGSSMTATMDIKPD